MTPEERKATLKHKGFNQQSLADKIYYDPSMISRALLYAPEGWERLKRAIVAALGVDYDEFWNDDVKHSVKS